MHFHNAGGQFGSAIAWHPYGGVRRRSLLSTDDLVTTLAATSGATLPIWVTEAGAHVNDNYVPGQTEAEQDAQVRWMTDRVAGLAGARPRHAHPLLQRAPGARHRREHVRAEARLPVGLRADPRLRGQAAGLVRVVPRSAGGRCRLLRRLAGRRVLGAVPARRDLARQRRRRRALPQVVGRQGRSRVVGRRQAGRGHEQRAEPRGAGGQAARHTRARLRQHRQAPSLRRNRVVGLEQPRRPDLRRPGRLAAQGHVDPRRLHPRRRQRHPPPLPQRGHRVERRLDLDRRAAGRGHVGTGVGVERHRAGGRVRARIGTPRSGAGRWPAPGGHGRASAAPPPRHPR